MGITVKKKKLTVKTLRAQPGESAAADDSEAKSGTSEMPSAPESGIPMAAPPVAAAPAVKPASYTLAGTLAIIAVIMFITLIVLQSLEWNFFNDAFPRPLQPGAASAPGAYAPTSPTALEPLAPQPLDALDE